jgi:hypothetical protein
MQIKHGSPRHTIRTLHPCRIPSSSSRWTWHGLPHISTMVPWASQGRNSMGSGTESVIITTADWKNLEGVGVCRSTVSTDSQNLEVVPSVSRKQMSAIRFVLVETQFQQRSNTRNILRRVLPEKLGHPLFSKIWGIFTSGFVKMILEACAQVFGFLPPNS